MTDNTDDDDDDDDTFKVTGNLFIFPLTMVKAKKTHFKDHKRHGTAVPMGPILSDSLADTKSAGWRSLTNTHRCHAALQEVCRRCRCWRWKLSLEEEEVTVKRANHRRCQDVIKTTVRYTSHRWKRYQRQPLKTDWRLQHLQREELPLTATLSHMPLLMLQK